MPYWKSITECKDCKIKGAYWTLDMHPSNPCPECGGILKEKIGRFTPGNRWQSFRLMMGLAAMGKWEIKER